MQNLKQKGYHFVLHLRISPCLDIPVFVFINTNFFQILRQELFSLGVALYIVQFKKWKFG